MLFRYGLIQSHEGGGDVMKRNMLLARRPDRADLIKLDVPGVDVMLRSSRHRCDCCGCRVHVRFITHKYVYRYGIRNPFVCGWCVNRLQAVQFGSKLDVSGSGKEVGDE